MGAILEFCHTVCFVFVLILKSVISRSVFIDEFFLLPFHMPHNFYWILYSVKIM